MNEFKTPQDGAEDSRVQSEHQKEEYSSQGKNL